MNVLGIFVKHPVPGQVKTRMAREIGDERAAQLYEAFTADIVDRFRQTAERRVLCYTPDTAQADDYFQAITANSLPTPDYVLWPQPNGSLGQRLEQFFAQAFADGAARVVIIGSDSPTLPLEFVERAFALLGDHDCVLGPAADGGYYLIGQSGQPRPIFTDVDWGSSRVYEQTAALIAGCGARLALLPQWYDVDTAADLETVCRDLAASRQRGADPSLPRTERALGE